MKYTVIQAAKITGKSRQTIYRHIDSKPISVTQDDDGNQLIDASELIRVYGNDINFGALDDKAGEGDKAETVAKPEIRKKRNVWMLPGIERSGTGSTSSRKRLNSSTDTSASSSSSMSGMPASSRTASATQIAAPVRDANAIASDGRESMTRTWSPWTMVISA